MLQNQDFSIYGSWILSIWQQEFESLDYNQSMCKLWANTFTCQKMLFCYRYEFYTSLETINGLWSLSSAWEWNINVILSISS